MPTITTDAVEIDVDGEGHDMDHYADDLAELTGHVNLQHAVHVRHSTGGGEVAHYIARHGESRVAKAVLIDAVPPLIIQTDANPVARARERVRRSAVQARRQPVRVLPGIAVGRPTVTTVPVESSEAITANCWRQGMMGGAKAHHHGIVAFSQTDFTEDLKKITVPVL